MYVEHRDAALIGGKILTHPQETENINAERRVRTGFDDKQRGRIDHMFVTGTNYDELREIQMQMTPYAGLVEGIDFSIIQEARAMVQKWMIEAFQSKKGVCVVADFPTGFQGGVFQDVMDLEEQHQIGARRILLTDRTERETRAACDEYDIDRSAIHTVRRPKSTHARIQTDGVWMQKLHRLFQR